ncbi:MAG: DUF4097 domain-containing protein [Oscillospiraceae bacterium]|nr:DUF4097 domain-containing protein [Oscillospiraceae bacterium]
MRKAIISISIVLWSIIGLVIGTVLIYKIFDIPTPQWVQDLPGRFNFGRGNVVMLKEESFPIDGVRDIRVGGSYQSVIVTLHDGRDLEVKHYDYDTEKGFAMRADGREIVIDAPKRSFGLFTYGGNPRLEIAVPKAYAENVSFSTVSGSVTVEDYAAWRDVTLKTTSGSILVQTLTAAQTDVHSVSGSVKLEGKVSCTSLNVKTTSGSVAMSDCAVSGPVTLKTVSGKISAGDIQGSSISGDTTSGSQTYGDLDAAGLIKLKSVSGSVNAGAVRSPSHDIKTTSGGIRIGELTGDGPVKTTSGSVRTG